MTQAARDMQLAEILSDLVSLRPGVCDPAAALALTSLRASPSTTDSAPSAPEADDPDLARAKELVRLHYDVRERCKKGELSAGLAEARGSVERALG